MKIKKISYDDDYSSCNIARNWPFIILYEWVFVCECVCDCVWLCVFVCKIDRWNVSKKCVFDIDKCISSWWLYYFQFRLIILSIKCLFLVWVDLTVIEHPNITALTGIKLDSFGKKTGCKFTKLLKQICKIFFVNLGLKILRLLRLIVVFEADIIKRWG